VYGRLVPFATGGALRERERELEMMREGLAGACAGEGALLLVEGAAGVGKTELVREARAEAEHARMTPLEARGSELEAPFAFGVVRQLLEPVILKPTAPSTLFAGAAAPAARLFDSDEGPPRSGDGQFRAFHSLYWLIVNLADDGPLVVLVDDCHWSDRDSLRFISYLAQRIEGLPVAMVLAGRPPDSADSEATSVWAQLASRPSTTALTPRPLSQSAATVLARERLGGDADEEFCRACHVATGGNPLFLRELLGGLEAAGVVPSAEAAPEVQSVGPAAVSRFVLHRLAALGPRASELARAVAVLGDDTELELAAAVSGVPVDSARETADDLIRADIFARSDRLGFVHPIVRAALYEDMLSGERHARHAAVVDALIDRGAAPERITAHLLLTPATGDPRRVAILRSAALGAVRRGAPGAAVARLHRALAESPSDQERAEILTELGRWELAQMQFAASEEHLQACLASNASVETRADAASWLGRCAIVSGGHSSEAAIDALASLAAEIRPADPVRSLELGADLLMVATAVLRLQADYGGHLERFRNQALGHPDFEAVAALHDARESLFHGGSASAAMDQVESALMSGIPNGAEQAVLLALYLLRYGERYDLASRILAAGLDQARIEGHAARQGIIHRERAAIAFARGSLHDAQIEAETGLMLVEYPHIAIFQLSAVAILVHVERGDLDAAAEAAHSVDVLGVSEDHGGVVEFLVARARLRIAQGLVREGVAELLRCGERLRALGLVWPNEMNGYAAAALASLGEQGEAARLASELLVTARRVGAPGALGKSLRLAGAAGPDDERLTLLEEAVVILEPSETRLELGHTLADLGTELTRLGRRREGRDAQRRAIRLAEACGAAALEQRARAELQSGPGRRARTDLTGRGALTASEWRVCREAVSGRTNREIAQELFVTEKTVERHLSNAYQKLGIRSRFQLTAAIND
jgi:DNA-binding CsgD family transcriptional regulator